MIQWRKERNRETCENVHVMYDGPGMVATIRNMGKGPRRFQVQIRNNLPWHRRSLKAAKLDCEWVYNNTKNFSR